MAAREGWRKSDPHSVERFNSAVPDHPAAERRKMFGYPACFVNGHYVAGLHQDDFVIRVPADIRMGFPELNDALGFDPTGGGKPLKDWYVIPAAIAEDAGRLARLLHTAVVEVAKLPPKERKQSKGRGRPE